MTEPYAYRMDVWPAVISTPSGVVLVPMPEGLAVSGEEFLDRRQLVRQIASLPVLEAACQRALDGLREFTAGFRHDEIPDYVLSCQRELSRALWIGDYCLPSDDALEVARQCYIDGVKSVELSMVEDEIHLALAEEGWPLGYEWEYETEIERRTEQRLELSQ